MQRYLLNAFLWAISVALFMGGVSVYFAPPVLPVPQSVGPARDSVSPVSGLFGARDLIGSRLFVPSDISVLGVLAQGERGSVLVSISNGPVRTISAGKPEPDGWVLHRVDAHQVVLGHFGQRVIVSLEGASQALSK